MITIIIKNYKHNRVYAQPSFVISWAYPHLSFGITKTYFFILRIIYIRTHTHTHIKLSRNISIHHVLFIVREENQDEAKIFEAF
jgi:hypothetical protein